MSKFQIILLAVFGGFIVIAVLVFSFFKSSNSNSASVVVWGDIPAYDWGNMVNTSGLNQSKDVSLSYVEIPSDEINQEFTDALAEGRAPDLIILSTEDIWKQRNRIIPIPYENVSERNFKEAFIEEGELLLSPQGVYALPLLVDPLVLYYNRDSLTKASISRPISYWDEIYDSATKLTERDGAGNIKKSVIALGESTNIPNYKSILSLLMLQAGTPITSLAGSSDNLELRARLTENFNLPAVPAEAALDFYTQFSNPSRVFYSWNRSLLPAQTNFTAGDSAYYIGFASELRVIKAKNPTLNLGVTKVPQSRVSSSNMTLGKLKAIAVSRGSRNPSAALSTALTLVSAGPAKALADSSLLSPARRDLLSTLPQDSVLSVFYESALQSRGWLDPDSLATEKTFKEMVDSVTSGRARITEAVRKGNDELNSLAR